MKFGDVIEKACSSPARGGLSIVKLQKAFHRTGTNERLEVAAVSWNLVCNLVALRRHSETRDSRFEMGCDGCKVHDEDLRRGACHMKLLLVKLVTEILE